MPNLAATIQVQYTVALTSPFYLRAWAGHWVEHTVVPATGTSGGAAALVGTSTRATLAGPALGATITARW